MLVPRHPLTPALLLLVASIRVDVVGRHPGLTSSSLPGERRRLLRGPPLGQLRRIAGPSTSPGTGRGAVVSAGRLLRSSASAAVPVGQRP